MKDYEVLSVKVWGGNKTEKRDDEGYVMMSLTLTGHTGEPIDYKAKVVPEVGSTLHGELVDYTSNAGNDRTRFETAETKRKDNSKQNMITAQWAVSRAIEVAPDHEDEKKIKDLAEVYIKIAKELAEE